MNIIVCIKQVPDTTKVRINPKTNTLIREGVRSIINPFDVYALEEALRLKEKHGGTVTALTMGPPQAEAALREAIALGVDEAYLLVRPRVRRLRHAGPPRTRWPRASGSSASADLILCGKQAIDGDTAQVGPGVAEHLGIPFLGYVAARSRGARPGSIVVERLIEDGSDVVESTPARRFSPWSRRSTSRACPSLKGKMRAKARPTTWNAADLGADAARLGFAGSPTKVVKIFHPEPRRGGEIIDGRAGRGCRAPGRARCARWGSADDHGPGASRAVHRLRRVRRLLPGRRHRDARRTGRSSTTPAPSAAPASPPARSTPSRWSTGAGRPGPASPAAASGSSPSAPRPARRRFARADGQGAPARRPQGRRADGAGLRRRGWRRRPAN